MNGCESSSGLGWIACEVQYSNSVSSAGRLCSSVGQLNCFLAYQPEAGTCGTATVGGICVAHYMFWNGYDPGSLLEPVEPTPVTTSQCPVQTSTKDVGKTCDSDGECGEPIVMAAGNKFLTETDFVSPGLNSLKLERSYNSALVASSAPNFAQGWIHNYATFITAPSSSSVIASRSDGKSYTFTLVGGTWTPDADVTDKLVQLTSGSTVTGWQYTNASDDSLETYDAYGNLSSIAYREGTTVTLSYSGETMFPAPLASVTDSFGHTITFGTSAGSPTITDPKGETYTYTLGGTGVLSSITYPDGTSKSYLYNEAAYTGGANYPVALTGVMDENNSRYDTTWYDASGAAVETALAGGVGRYTISNTLDTNTLDWAGRIQGTSLVDPLGATLGRSFTSRVNRNRLSSVSQPAANGQPAGSKAFSFDMNGNIIESTDLNGNVQCSMFDLTRNLETGRVEGLAPGSTCPSNISTYIPTAGTVQRKTLTQYHSIWHLPAQRAEPLKITTWAFNGDGGVYCAPSTAKVGNNPIGVVCSRSEQATTDGTGGSGFSATASGSARVWSYTYSAFGQILTAKGPRTDINDTTTYGYYNCTSGGQCGQLHTVTDALGHVTTYNTYDGNGNPLTVTNPNGVVTTLTYDARQRLKAYQIGSEITSISYYPTGQVQTITQPDGSTLTYTYDAAHRLTAITDGLGNKISYTLDAMGGHLAERAYAPGNVPVRQLGKTYNSLGSVITDIPSANTSQTSTQYTYDAEGNQTAIMAPLSRTTNVAFDALNRMRQITDPGNGVASTGYDSRDVPTSVTDPRNLTTNYSNTGFEQVTTLDSPDSGTRTNTFDSAGNLATSTDAVGSVGTFQYDALNRLTEATYTGSRFYTISNSYVYDTCTNGFGKLCQTMDEVGTTTYSYTPQGRLASRTEADSATSGGGTFDLRYTYNLAGQVSSFQMPSGAVVTFTYNGNNQVASVSVTVNGTSTTILSGATYDPFGPLNGWTWGNGAHAIRQHDHDGNISAISTTGLNLSISYDNAQRIQSINDLDNPSLSWAYTYDSLDRLTAASNGTTSEGWTYDANGNRMTQTSSAAGQQFTIVMQPNSNRIQTLNGGGSQSYDANGNTTEGYYQDPFLYDNEQDAGAGSTAVNVWRQRVNMGSGEERRVYDLDGHLIGQYVSDDPSVIIPLVETVWLGDLPIAALEYTRNFDAQGNYTGSTQALYYVHADQIGTPRRLTQPSSNAIVWRWDSDPFGYGNPVGNPAGSPIPGYMVYNLRFPGQVYDGFTYTYYNLFRDYNPATGSYLQTDPIGLYGGSYSTYAYVGGNPISNVDPFGLCVDRDACKKLVERIKNKMRDFDDAYSKYDPLTDYYGGFAKRYFPYTTKPLGHYNKLLLAQQGLVKDIAEYNRLHCDEDDDDGPGFGPVPWQALIDSTRILDIPHGWTFDSQTATPPGSATTAAGAAILKSILDSLLVN